MVRIRSVLRGLVIQKIEGLLVADSCPDSIEAPIPCQTSAYCFRSLFCLPCQRFNSSIKFFVADLHIFFFRYFFEQQSRLHIVDRLISLASPKTVQIHFLHLLRRSGLAPPALEAHAQAECRSAARSANPELRNRCAGSVRPPAFPWLRVPLRDCAPIPSARGSAS